MFDVENHLKAGINCNLHILPVETFFDKQKSAARYKQKKKLVGSMRNQILLSPKYDFLHNVLSIIRFKIQPKKLAHFACESTQRAEFMVGKKILVWIDL